ncbi:MAG: CDP-diacylglycerol--glycerol-3-phosphate 3-phosphatidyltransferase [Lentisphaeraceae bacterium]|nr:CDP-diacylglycerol--glycerol-3-phosphate 3-phosphatidyltransferase [Lentisphaeraceae bacterium]
MNIANKITMSRILLTVIFVILASMESQACRWAAWGAGFLAAISDVLDGYLARKYELVTDFGKLMDPLADKIFVSAAFIVLVENNIVPGWIVIIIVSREFAVTGLRLLAAQKGRVISAAVGGKVKTLLQFIYLGTGGVVWGLYGQKGLTAITAEPVLYCMSGLMIATAVVTVYTGYEYFVKNKELYLESI